MKIRIDSIIAYRNMKNPFLRQFSNAVHSCCQDVSVFLGVHTGKLSFEDNFKTEFSCMDERIMEIKDSARRDEPKKVP